jgi:hypothetical protein
MAVTKILSSITNSTPIRKTSKFIGNNTGKFAVASILIKDGFNTYYYYNQSLQNDKIPENKRKFVASLDLMNGILNQVLQLSLGLIISGKRCQSLLSSKLMGKWILKEVKDIKPKNIKAFKEAGGFVKIIKNKATGAKEYKGIKYLFNEGRVNELYEKSGKNKSLEDFRKKREFFVSTGKIGIELVTSLGGTAIIGKRMLTPLIATPLAGWYKDKFLKDKQSIKPYTVPKQHMNEDNAIAFYKQLRNNHLQRGQ